MASAAEDEAAAEAAAAKAGTVVATHVRQKPARRPLPEHLPRERVVVPPPTSCRCCGGNRLAKIGEVVTETLDVVPRRWFVRQTVREKLTCRDCETISEPPAPFHVIPRARIGASLLAMILFEKYGCHQPLNRQSERYAREGVDLDLSSLADHVGAGAAALAPLHELIRAHVLAAERLHGDDTTVPVLAKGKTITGRLWAYVRDDRPFGQVRPGRRQSSSTIPATGAASIPSSIWPAMPGSCRPTPTVASAALCADASGRPDHRSARWAHARRGFFELADLGRARKGRQHPHGIGGGPPIDAIFAHDARSTAIRRRPARLSPRAHGSPGHELEGWMRSERPKLSRHAEVAKAIDYMLKRWPAFSRFLDDGRIA